MGSRGIKMKIGVPVKCQNGHRAVWFYSFRGLDVISEVVDRELQCDCEYPESGQGYFADGEPFVVVGNPPQWEELTTS